MNHSTNSFRIALALFLTWTMLTQSHAREVDAPKYSSVQIDAVPHIRQKPDFCGEACAAMFLRKLGALSFAVARMRSKEGSGSRLADRRGGRMEFADHRPYVMGDDVRDLDWSAHARTGRLYVKQYERTVYVSAAFARKSEIFSYRSCRSAESLRKHRTA